MFENKVRCNNCMSVFYEDYIKDENICPVCSAKGCIMDTFESEFPQYYDDTPKYDKYDKRYPLLSLGNDPVILYDNLDEEDLIFVEHTLEEYENGIIKLSQNKKGEYFLIQDNAETFGGLIVEVLKWYKGIIRADDLAPMFILAF
jgi:hypothetical protein